VSNNVHGDLDRSWKHQLTLAIKLME